MKLFLLIVIAFAVGISCAPQQSDTESATAAEEKQVDDLLNEIQEYYRSRAYRQKDIEKFLFGEIDSFDRKCIVNEYKRLDMLSQIPNSLGLDEPMDEDSVKKIVSFVVTTFGCYKRFNVLVEYVFEMVTTQGILLRAFIDDPELADVKKYVTCANHYAHTNNFWKPEDYSLQYEPASEDLERCEELIEMVEKAWKKTTKSFFRDVVTESDLECYSQFFRNLKKFLVKYPLLIQVELTDAQHDEEFLHFKKDFRGFFKKYARCSNLHRTYDSDTDDW